MDIFLKKVDNASLRRYGPTYAYFLFLTRRDSLEQETFHESLEFFLNFQDADIFHFVKTMVKYYREEHGPVTSAKALRCSLCRLFKNCF